MKSFLFDHLTIRSLPLNLFFDYRLSIVVRYNWYTCFSHNDPNCSISLHTILPLWLKADQYHLQKKMRRWRLKDSNFIHFSDKVYGFSPICSSSPLFMSQICSFLIFLLFHGSLIFNWVLGKRLSWRWFMIVMAMVDHESWEVNGYVGGEKCLEKKRGTRKKEYGLKWAGWCHLLIFNNNRVLI